ncbi:hypothetical protein DVA79_22015, partial [Acinetobacter baumannii]
QLLLTLQKKLYLQQPLKPRSLANHQIRLMTEKQREEAEWENMNVLLMMHGLKPLSLVKRTDMKDLIIFDKQSSQTMRE